MIGNELAILLLISSTQYCGMIHAAVTFRDRMRMSVTDVDVFNITNLATRYISYPSVLSQLELSKELSRQAPPRAVDS